MPVQLVSFTARKANAKDVLAGWITASEYNVSHFEIEVAKGIVDFQQSRYTKIGEVKSRGNSDMEQQYDFTDTENNKTGVRYYRLKIVENDGSFNYSVIRPVVFNEEIKWVITPNPSSGIFNLTCQANDGEGISIKVYDLNGRMVYRFYNTSSGFVQKLTINLSGIKYPAGLYMLEAKTGEKTHSFRLLKQ